MKLLKLIALLAACFSAAVVTFAAGDVKVSEVSGSASIAVPGEQSEELLPLAAGDTLKPGTVVTAGKDSFVRIAYPNGTVIVVPANSSIVIQSFEYNGNPVAPGGKEPSGAKSTTAIKVISGSVAVQTNLNKDSSVKVEAVGGTVVASQGTFVVSAAQRFASVEVTSGSVKAVTTTGVASEVQAGKAVTVEQGSSTVTNVPVSESAAALASTVAPTKAPAQGAAAAAAPASVDAPVVIDGQNSVHTGTNSPSV